MIRIAICVLVTMATVAIAGAEPLSYKEEFKPSSRASIKVLGPDGARVSSADGEDSLPSVIHVDNTDAFVPVTFTYNGEKLVAKVEVRRNYVTEVRVSYNAPAAAQKGPTRTFVAQLHNGMDTCEPALRHTVLSFELINHATAVGVGTFEVRAGGISQLENLVAGAVDVRIYDARTSKWIATTPYNIDKDGIEIYYGCR